jgi:hypothetical protein
MPEQIHLVAIAFSVIDDRCARSDSVLSKFLYLPAVMS